MSANEEIIDKDIYIEKDEQSFLDNIEQLEAGYAFHYYFTGYYVMAIKAFQPNAKKGIF